VPSAWEHDPAAVALAETKDGPVIRSGVASYVRVPGQMVDSGRLELSSDRLTFRPNWMNIGAAALAWSLTAIESAEHGRGPLALAVRMRGGRTVVFRAYRRADWIAAIDNARVGRSAGRS
jgi:hypothetical protein